MPFSWEEILHKWLLGRRIGYSSSEIVEAFNAVERVFGAEWFNRFQNRRGSYVVIKIVDIGRTLMELESMPDATKMMDKIKKGVHGSRTEAQLVAHYRRRGLEVELEPELLVKGKVKHPDMRVKFKNKWIYIEAATPTISQHQNEMNMVMLRISRVAKEIEKSRHIEVYLYKDPTEEEIRQVIRASKKLGQSDVQPQEHKIEGVAQIFSNSIGEEKLSTFKDAIEEERPVLVHVNAELKTGSRGEVVRRRQATVKMPFTDERAQRVFNKEAEQLSRKEPGMIVIDASRIPGLKRWSDLTRKRLQPSLNRRVGAVLLLQNTITADLMSTEVILIKHPRPIHPIPEDFLKITRTWVS